MFNHHEKKAYQLLDKYRITLNKSQYMILKSIVANQVLEGLYPSEQNIQDLIDVITKKKTYQEVIENIINDSQIDTLNYA